ncbi:hypothetical protein [Bacillus paranthracis]|uniref:hypothetical protein n=1 Tax=Bacillus paranthracis TaxID=2026186 RepID=UPI0022E18441|nr:hypothetical protein [Bacillus paranthracis]
MYGNTNYVTTSIRRMKKRLRETTDKDDARISEIQDVVDSGIAQFAQKIRMGQVDIGVSEFEKLAKIQMLLLQKPTEIIENQSDVEAEEEIRYEALLPEGDMEALKAQLFAKMNERNEDGKRE